MRAIQALFCLGSSLSPLPAPKTTNQLIRTGPYSQCRHPLYRAVLICSAGVVIATGSLLHLALLISLALVLRGKARFEEAGLRQVHAMTSTPPSLQPSSALFPVWTGAESMRHAASACVRSRSS